MGKAQVDSARKATNTQGCGTGHAGACDTSCRRGRHGGCEGREARKDEGGLGWNGMGEKGRRRKRGKKLSKNRDGDGD